MASLGSLFIELAANTARLQSDMGKAVSIVQGASNRISSVFRGLAGVGAGVGFAGLVSHSIELGDSLNKAAIKAGIAAKPMSELAYAAKLADVDLQSLSTALKKMQISLSEAASGGKQQNETLQALGLTLRDLQGLQADRQFEVLGDRINRLKDPADRARAAVDLFGKAGADLLPLFEQGAEGIRKAREEAQRLGLSFGEEQIKRLADADDAIKRMKASWEGLASTLTAKVAPALTTVFNNLAGAVSGNRLNQLQQQIDFLEKVKGEGFFSLALSTYKDIGTGYFTAEEGAQKLAELRRKMSILRGDSRGHVGGDRYGQGGDSADPPGFKAVADLTEQSKKNDAELADLAKSAQTYSDIALKSMAESAGSVTQNLQDEQDAAERRDRYFQESVQKQNELSELASRESKRAAEESQSAWTDVFFTAMEDGLDGLVRKWKQTMKLLVAEAAASGVLSFLKGGSFLGGFSNGLSSGVAGLGKLFGFANEGSILPGGSGGTDSQVVAFRKSPDEQVDIYRPGRHSGGATVHIYQTNDFRGATPDVMRAVPALIARANQALEVRIVEGLRNGRYA